MKTLGVTGGIGSGKTTVCRIFEALGARVFYADAEAKRLMHEDTALRAEIEATFGPASYDAEGHLDRAYLARQVFGDAEALARLNALVHPRVFAAFAQARQDAEHDGVPLLVHEAALIFEAGVDRHLDAVAVVVADEAERIRRVVARDAVTPDQVRARMGHQLPPDEVRRRTDFLIENTGSIEELHAKVEAVYRAMTEATSG